MRQGKKIALLFGVAAGAALAALVFGKSGKRIKSNLDKKNDVQTITSNSLEKEDTEAFYI